MHPKQRLRFPGRLWPAKTASCTASSAHQPDPGHRHPCCCASPHAAKRASRGPAGREWAATIPIAISGHRFSPTRFWLTGAASITEGQLRHSCAAPPSQKRSSFCLSARPPPPRAHPRQCAARRQAKNALCYVHNMIMCNSPREAPSVVTRRRFPARRTAPNSYPSGERRGAEFWRSRISVCG